MSDRVVGRTKAVGDSLKVMMPSAEALLAAGAKFGAVKTGARVAGMFVRRHPAVAVATVAGAGLLWYAAKRRSARAERGNIETGTVTGASLGRSTRIEARNATEVPNRRKATSTVGTRKRAATARAARDATSDNSTSTY
ncbi:hypothetical protein ACFFGH_00740 [Lysobacter korlensis]|uniref:DUF3618 domain-containing protein n=1 Tax=Lysobacter korlensis TaxID=553636 RepID=A0ABV6RHB2_9GAMM